MPQVDLRPRPQRTPHSALWHLNAFLARPIAAVFGLLGVAAGQLSLQSVTVTVVGLLRGAQGDWPHLVQGAFIVYFGLLLDRADDILQLRGKSMSAWSRYLGLMVDRLIEVGLLLALAWLGTRNTGGWTPLDSTPFLLVVAAGVAAVLLARLANLYGDLLILRIHLANTKRLPGPSAVPRGAQASPLLSRLLDRDFFVTLWVAGVALRQFQAVAVVLLASQLVVMVEGFVLFFQRRKDAEPHAAHVLARGP